MVGIDREITRHALKTRMLIQVHDELVFEAPAQEVEKAEGIVREQMENALEFSVPLKVNVSTGNNWEEAH